jgi:hypothetical protein
MKVKKFVFLYPEKRIFDWEVFCNAHHIYDQWEKAEGKNFNPEKAKTKKQRIRVEQAARRSLINYFRPIYSKKLNSCIHHRYRRRGFQIVFLMADYEFEIGYVDVKSEDQVVYVRDKIKDGRFYPAPGHVLKKILPVDILRIGGFHMWDCVQKFAKAAHNKGVDTLVDEDLTEFFGFRMHERDFRVKTYPNYKPSEQWRSLFIKTRRGKPWLWQNY